MHRIDDHFNDTFIDFWDHIGPKRRQLLEESWAGVFRNYLFDELPMTEIRAKFHATMGRPSKELYAMCGTLILQQLFDYTDEQTVSAFAFHTDWHYALDIHDESDRSMYVCERTLREYRRWAVESDVAKTLFGSLTDKLRDAFQVKTEKQRLDSTHLFSNMKRLSRLDLFVRTIEKFLKELKRLHPRIWQKEIDEEWVARYVKKEKQGCFSRVSGEEAKRTLQSVSEDLLVLVRRFESHNQVSRLESFRLMQRVLDEQCEVKADEAEEQVELKEPKEVSGASLQNPSDPDATYDGHKGQGYQAQIMETYTEEENDATLPLILAIEVETAYARDEDAPETMIRETQERDCAPEILLADAAYGSDANVQKAAEEGIDLIAPTKGKPKRKEEMLILDDFRTDEVSGEINACPAGETPTKTTKTKKGNFQAEFDPEVCRQCDHQEYCEVGRGETGYRLDYTEKELRLAKRRAMEESEAFKDQYRWRSGIEATNAKLKQVLKMGRLRVRGLKQVRHAVTLKALSWNLLQAVRAKKARIVLILALRTAKRIGRMDPAFLFHCVVGISASPADDRFVLPLEFAA